MQLTAYQDIFGKPEHLTSTELRHILDLIDGYMKVPYEIAEIRRDSVNDPNGRFDIEVRFQNEHGDVIQQKLLILKDELIDGKTFHKRYKEWYGDKNTGTN